MFALGKPVDISANVTVNHSVAIPSLMSSTAELLGSSGVLLCRHKY